MNNGYTPRDILREVLTFGASQSNQQVSEEAGLYAGGAIHGFRVDFKVSGVTAGTGISAKLQQRTIDAWSDLAGANASVAITADGEYSLKQLALISADQPNFPIKKMIRVLVTTGTGSAVTFDEMYLLQPL